MSFKHITLALFVGTTLLASSSGDPRRAGDPIGSTHGSVVISTHHVDGGREMNVVLLVDESQESLATDGQVDRVFVLQAAGGSVRTMDLRIPMAQVDWGSGVVQVRSTSGHHLVFTVNPGDESSSQPSQRLQGFGLMHLVGWDLPLPESPLTDADYLDLFAGLYANSKCADTKPPHTYCELDAENCIGGGCSVTCVAGSEACCECSGGKPSCKCQTPS